MKLFCMVDRCLTNLSKPKAHTTPRVNLNMGCIIYMVLIPLWWEIWEWGRLCMYWGSEYKENFCIFHLEWYIPFNISVNLKFLWKITSNKYIFNFQKCKKRVLLVTIPREFLKDKRWSLRIPHGGIGPLVHCWCDYKTVEPLQKTVWKFFKIYI